MKLSQKEAELHELVITGLTHLVSANSESGFKQCLPLAYDLDNRKRTIFAHVFARVIGQGTVFDPEDKTAVKSRHAALCEVGFYHSQLFLLRIYLIDLSQLVRGSDVSTFHFSLKSSTKSTPANSCPNNMRDLPAK